MAEHHTTTETCHQRQVTSLSARAVTCRPASLSVCLSACLYFCLSVCLPVSLILAVNFCLPVPLSVSLSLSACKYTCRVSFCAVTLVTIRVYGCVGMTFTCFFMAVKGMDITCVVCGCPGIIVSCILWLYVSITSWLFVCLFVCFRLLLLRGYVCHLCYCDCTDNVLSPALPADVQVCIAPVLSL